ncbi:MAG: hypothetical protein HRT90_03815, partial [Candidatus Margulisbacteria bacterium]|nr:hypothetical protein [Candidatus Margulisiibacteriota bacterium]
MISYYPHKIKEKALSYLHKIIHRFSSGPGFRHGAFTKQFEFKDKLVLAFWDPRLVHLGDQLFHTELVRTCLANNIHVTTIGPTPLADYFKALGSDYYTLADCPPAIFDGAVIISKDDMVHQCKLKSASNGYFVGINYWHLEGTDPIMNLLTQTITKILNDHLNSSLKTNASNLEITPLAVTQSPPDANWLNTLQQIRQPVYLYNNFATSNIFSAMSRQTEMMQLIKDIKKEHRAAIVYIGSASEAKISIGDTSFIDL